MGHGAVEPAKGRRARVIVEKIGKYRILERIGRGGMGTVYRAHDPVLNRHVALKVISAEGDVSDELKARFFREARACARLNHPNIVVVYDLGEDGDRLFYVMELLEGSELKGVIAERRPMALETKLALMQQVCDGLQYAHENNIVHRDIKPGNIFLLPDGQVKILDFGIARLTAGDAGLTRTGLVMGTLRYMSPEQARGRADTRSDIFSVGAVFYELFAHRPAFDREHPLEILEQLRTEEPPPLTELDPEIPPELWVIIARALRKAPADRYQTLAAMRDD
ncbi:MAG TPA: serine/threonine-protein kinase, partial [Solirubrobacterales bacterium]|nr:serine/threonine-protein kinase [Solirubrobacterales bacterium]